MPPEPDPTPPRTTRSRRSASAGPDLSQGLVSTREMCRLLCCSRRTLYRLISTKQIPRGRRIRGQNYLPRAEFMEALKRLYANGRG